MWMISFFLTLNQTEKGGTYNQSTNTLGANGPKIPNKVNRNEGRQSVPD